MKKLLLSLFILVISISSSEAANWVYVTKDNKGASYYVDTEYLAPLLEATPSNKKITGTHKVATKVEMPQPTSLPSASNTAYLFMTIEYDFDKNLCKYIYSSTYRADNTLINRDTYPMAQWEKIPPQTPVDDIKEFVRTYQPAPNSAPLEWTYLTKDDKGTLYYINTASFSSLAEKKVDFKHLSETPIPPNGGPDWPKMAIEVLVKQRLTTPTYQDLSYTIMTFEYDPVYQIYKVMRSASYLSNDKLSRQSSFPDAQWKELPTEDPLGEVFKKILPFN